MHMRTALHHLFAALLLATLLPAAARAVSLDESAAVARRDLDASLKELSGQRETIAAEKLPLMHELDRLENELSDLRREQENSRRAVDNRNLELNNRKAELKQHQDEATYIGSLLDEYARSFEARVQPGEAGRYRPALDAALLAPQDKDLTPSQKADRQFALVAASADRLESLIGGTRFEGTAVDPQGALDKGRFALIGPVALFASDDGRVAGLALPQAGSSNPTVRPLPDKNAGVQLAGLIATGSGTLLFDPTLGNALKALIARGTLWGYFRKGGPIMWPLLLVSLLSVSVLLERLVFLGVEKKRRQPQVVEEIMGALEKGDVETAIRTGKASPDYVARCLTYALVHREKSLTDALSRSSAQELVRFTRGISLLDTIVTMAPLLGLLGTVTGMISAFGMLGGSELSAPSAITGGIAEALIATTFGLGIAVTTLIPLNFLHARCESARHEMEDATTNLELLVKPLMEAGPARKFAAAAASPVGAGVDRAPAVGAGVDRARLPAT